MPPDVGFDRIQLTDPVQRLGGGRRRMPDMDIMDFTPGMGHAADLADMASFIQRVAARIGTRLQQSAEPGQMRLRVSAFTPDPLPPWGGTFRG